MDVLDNKQDINTNSLSGTENRSFLLDDSGNKEVISEGDFDLLKSINNKDLDQKVLQQDDIVQLDDEAINLAANKIKYIENETNLELRKIDTQGINSDEPFSYLRKMGGYIKEAIDYNKYIREVEKIGEDVARYVWAYKEGNLGDFDQGNFAKEIFKAGARNLGGQNLHLAGNMFKMLGANLEENAKGFGPIVGGVSLVLPDVGENFKLLGDMLDNVALDIENSDILLPAEEVFEEDPNWMNIANVIGQGAGSVLSMGLSSKVIGSKATYGLFAIGGAGDIFDESIDKDGDINKANALASINAGANFAIDKFFNPLPKQLEKGIKRTSSLIAKEILNSPLRETASEVMQQVIAENLVRKVGIDDAQLLFEGVIESAIGGMAGSMFVVGGDGIVYAANKTYENARKKIALKGVTAEELDFYEKNMLELMKLNPKAFDKILSYNLKQHLPKDYRRR
jgi:hypothetical protein